MLSLINTVTDEKSLILWDALLYMYVLQQMSRSRNIVSNVTAKRPRDTLDTLQLLKKKFVSVEIDVLFHDKLFIISLCL